MPFDAVTSPKNQGNRCNVRWQATLEIWREYEGSHSTACGLGAGTVVKISPAWPILRVVNTMTAKKSARPNEIEAAATARWLSATLAPARARVKTSPSTAAIDRMRTRVLGPEAAKRLKQRIAA